MIICVITLFIKLNNYQLRCLSICVDLGTVNSFCENNVESLCFNLPSRQSSKRMGKKLSKIIRVSRPKGIASVKEV